MGGKDPVVARLKEEEHKFALAKLKSDVKLISNDGKGCELLQRAPTKEGGYMQLPTSSGNSNKVLAHQIALFDNFEDLHRQLAENPKMFEGKDVSHLCHNRQCVRKSHLYLEDSIKNQRRKGCPGTVTVTRPCPCGHTFKVQLCKCCDTNKCI